MFDPFNNICTSCNDFKEKSVVVKTFKLLIELIPCLV